MCRQKIVEAPPQPTPANATASKGPTVGVGLAEMAEMTEMTWSVK